MGDRSGSLRIDVAAVGAQDRSMEPREPSQELTLLQTPRNVDRRIAGVCGGLAQRWHVDPLLIRVAAVLLLLSSGVGAVLYGAGWMLMPARPDTRAPIEQVFPGASRWSRKRVVWSVVIASIVVALLVGKFTPGGALPLVILAAVWFFARRRKTRQLSVTGRTATGAMTGAAAVGAESASYGAWSTADAHHRQASAPTEFDRAVHMWQQRLHQVSATQDSAPVPLPTADLAPRAGLLNRRPEPSWGRGLALIGIATGVFLLAFMVFGVSVAGADTPRALLVPASLALGVIAIGLLVGSRIGRPRLAVGAGLVLSAVLMIAIASPFDTMVPTVTSSEVSAIEALPEGGIVVEGQALDMDLSALVLDVDLTLPVVVHGGLLEITLPEQYTVIVEYHVNGGLLDLPNESFLGTADGIWTADQRGSHTLRLVVEIHGGSVSVS